MGLDKFFGRKNKKEGIADSKVARALAAGIVLGSGGAEAADALPPDVFPTHHYHYQMTPDGKIPPDVQDQMMKDRMSDYGITPEKLKEVQEKIDRKIEREKREMLGE